MGYSYGNNNKEDLRGEINYQTYHLWQAAEKCRQSEYVCALEFDNIQKTCALIYFIFL